MRDRDEQADHRTTAAEISRNFGYWQDQAIGGPVTVTSHGRPRVVILSVQEFERLSRGADGGPAQSASAANEAETALAGLLDHMRDGFVALDAQLRITHVNATVAAFSGQSAADMLGRDIEFLEGPGAAVLADRYRWVLRSGERISFETAPYAQPERQVSVDAFPWRGGVGVLFANRTEINRLRSERETWQALQAAIDACGGMMTAEMTPLGFFTKANQAFADFLGFREDQLAQVRLTDLLASADRSQVAEALNALLARRAPAKAIEATFLTRELGRRAARFSLAPMFQDAGCTAVVFAGQPQAAQALPEASA